MSAFGAHDRVYVRQGNQFAHRLWSKFKGISWNAAIFEPQTAVSAEFWEKTFITRLSQIIFYCFVMAALVSSSWCNRAIFSNLLSFGQSKLVFLIIRIVGRSSQSLGTIVVLSCSHTYSFVISLCFSWAGCALLPSWTDVMCWRWGAGKWISPGVMTQHRLYKAGTQKTQAQSVSCTSFCGSS